jgi:transcriptional regulator with XRE-family HTH domain
MNTKIDKKNLNVAAVGITMTPGEMVRNLRELKELSQLDLAKLTGISQTNISAIENERIEIGKQRAIVLAEALDVHPSSIMFADYSQKAS